MFCPYCGKPGIKRWKGYCCRAHRKLHRKPPKKIVPCAGCGTPQRRAPSAISRSGKVYCKACQRPKGEGHYRYKEGYIDRAGYRLVLLNGHYQKEHRLEWQHANKACLFERGSIHHIRIDLPHNKVYNDPDNLLLLSDKEHGRFHRLFDAERYEDSFQVLISAACRQLHYPQELDNWMSLVHSN